ncbi:MAG: S8 family peptidase [Bacteroidota bacterium]
MARKAAVFLLAILFITPATAQSTKHWVFFADKAGATQAEAGVLTPEALERRALRGGEIDSYDDAPVAERYLTALRTLGVEPVRTSRWLNAASAWMTPAERAAVETLPFVQSTRPVGLSDPAAVDVVEAVFTPLPAAGPLALDYGESETQLALMNAIEPLEQGFNGAGVRIGFLDTTYDFDHQVFERLVAENRLIAVIDTTGQGAQSNTHGHTVASTAVGFREGTLIGPCWGGEVLAATTEFAPSETNQEEDAFVAGMEWMEMMGADIVNVSLGYSTFDAGQRSYTTADLDGDTGVTTRAADRAAQRGVVVVTSAGNEGSSPWQRITTPADGDSVITVGAVTAEGVRAGFSSTGPTADGRTKPDVVAQGASTVIARSGSGYAFANGTSFSSPLTAGVVCQILQANPGLSPIEVRDLLRSTASQANNPDNLLGWGIVNAAAAVQGAITVDNEVETPALAGFTLNAVYPNPFADRATLSFEAPAAASETHVRVYDLLGRVVAEPFTGRPAPGLNTIQFDAYDWPAGVYLLSLETQNGTVAQQIVKR